MPHPLHSPLHAGERWAYLGPNNLQLYPAAHRHAANRAVYNNVAAWKLFEETVRVLEEALSARGGKKHALAHVPPHPRGALPAPGRHQGGPLAGITGLSAVGEAAHAGVRAVRSAAQAVAAVVVGAPRGGGGHAGSGGLLGHLGLLPRHRVHPAVVESHAVAPAYAASM